MNGTSAMNGTLGQSRIALARMYFCNIPFRVDGAPGEQIDGGGSVFGFALFFRVWKLCSRVDYYEGRLVVSFCGIGRWASVGALSQ